MCRIDLADRDWLSPIYFDDGIVSINLDYYGALSLFPGFGKKGEPILSGWYTNPIHLLCYQFFPYEICSRNTFIGKFGSGCYFFIVTGGTSPSFSGQIMDVTIETTRMEAITIREATTGTWKKSSMSIFTPTKLRIAARP